MVLDPVSVSISIRDSLLDPVSGTASSISHFSRSIRILNSSQITVRACRCIVYCFGIVASRLGVWTFNSSRRYDLRRWYLNFCFDSLPRHCFSCCRCRIAPSVNILLLDSSMLLVLLALSRQSALHWHLYRFNPLPRCDLVDDDWLLSFCFSYRLKHYYLCFFRYNLPSSSSSLLLLRSCIRMACSCITLVALSSSILILSSCIMLTYKKGSRFA